MEEAGRDSEAIAAAEDFRRQLQEKASLLVPQVRREDILAWFDNRLSHLRDLVTFSFGTLPNEVDLVTRMRNELVNISLPHPDDEPFTRTIVARLCKKIEATCQAIGISLGEGVAYGISPTVLLDAARHGVHFTDASVITLSHGFITFCSQVSKMFSESMIHENEHEGVRVTFDPAAVLARIKSNHSLWLYWIEVIGGYAFGLGALVVPRRLVPNPVSLTRMQLLSGMELFALAHEYGHHIGQHGRSEIASSELDPRFKQQEHEADLFSLAISRCVIDREEIPNFFALSGLAAVVLLKSLNCVKCARSILATGEEKADTFGTHPSVTERLHSLDDVDTELPEDTRKAYKHARADGAAIFDMMWADIRAVYKDMHRDGVRPVLSSQDQWLPW